MPPVRSNKLLIFTPYLEVLRSDWGGNFLLSEGVEQSGEEAAFAFHHRSAVTALSTTKSRIEQVPEGVAEHVEAVNGNRQEKTGQESQPWGHLHVLKPFPAEHPSPTGNLDGQSESEEAQRGLGNDDAADID